MKIHDRIVIEVIPHSEQFYDTVGDYRVRPYKDGLTGVEGEELVIRVSRMSDLRYQRLVAIHELAEIYLLGDTPVEVDDIDKFDMAFETTREEGNLDEPGDCVVSPYRNQHCFATAIERMMCAAFGLSWKEYEDEVNSLYKE